MADNQSHPSTGDANIPTGLTWIIFGAILMLWGVFVLLRGLVMLEPYSLVGLIPLGFGIALFVIGLNKRHIWKLYVEKISRG